MEITFDCGQAGKHEPNEDLTPYVDGTNQTPRFGYYWWFWLPHLKITKCEISLWWLNNWICMNFWY